MSIASVTATIPGTGSVSAGVLLPTQGLLGIAFLGAFADAPLSFLVDPTNTGNWSVLVDQYGNEVAIPSEAGQQIGLDPDDYVGYTAIKVRSGTSTNPVIQPSDAAVELFTLGATPPDSAQPNARRTLPEDGEYAQPGFMGTWTEMLATSEGDTLTANLGLDVGETISAILNFSLSVVGPNGVTDEAADSHGIGEPSISGSSVSQRFGNWQAIPYILYRVDIQIMTSLDNAPEFFGYLPVVMQPN